MLLLLLAKTDTVGLAVLTVKLPVAVWSAKGDFCTELFVAFLPDVRYATLWGNKVIN